MPANGRDNKSIIHDLDSIVGSQLPAGTDISIAVWDLDGDSAIYGYRENVMNRPASTMKILTSFTALKALGAEYEFLTTVKTDGIIGSDSILRGNVYLVGGLDPLLMDTDIRQLAATLAGNGVKSIEGDVIADVSIMDSIYWGSGWAWDDTPSSFQPYISPLMVNGGFVTVSVKPTQKGMAPTVKITPESEYYTVTNTSLNYTNPLGPLKITRDWINNRNTITISGNCQSASSIELNIYDCSKFALTLFTEYLTQNGISFNNSGFGKCPDPASILAFASHSLKDVMKETLKESVNLDAEAMFLQAARSGRSKKPTSFSAAATYEDAMYKQLLGKRIPAFNIADGSGLSMYDYIPASMFVEVLRLIYHNNEMYGIIYDSLPIAGYDGTLKNRLNGRPTSRNIHAKTGTVTGACTLAGYARSVDGRNMAFCIMNSGAIKMAPSRRVQDAVCLILCK